jgi:type IV secretory pathway VirB10-like protein
MTRSTWLLAVSAALAFAACKGTVTTTGGTSPTPVASEPDAGTAAMTPPPPPDTKPEPPPPPPPPPDPKVALMDAETAAYENAKPVFEKACAHCHTSSGAKANPGKLEHFNMTAYPFTGHHADSITKAIRHVLGVDGKKPSMPKDKPGSVKGDDLEKIKAWADAYDAAEAGGAHGAHADADHDEGHDEGHDHGHGAHHH